MAILVLLSYRRLSDKKSLCNQNLPKSLREKYRMQHNYKTGGSICENTATFWANFLIAFEYSDLKHDSHYN